MVGRAEVLGHVTTDGLAQFQQTEVGGVARLAAFECKDGGFANVPRRGEIRLAHAQRNDFRPTLDQFKKFTNARGRQRAHVAGNLIFNGYGF